MRRPRWAQLLRAAVLLATSGLAVCGVKGPPRPPEAAQAETAAGPALDAGAAADAGAALDAGAGDAGAAP